MGALSAVPFVRVSRGIVYAEANWGAWIANCTSEFCFDARLVLDGEPFECAVCGLIADVVWPQDRATIEYLLTLRPDPRTRNWNWRETVVDLAFENSLHGLGDNLTPEAGAASSRLVLDLSTDENRVILLPERVTIDAAKRPELES